MGQMDVAGAQTEVLVRPPSPLEPRLSIPMMIRPQPSFTTSTSTTLTGALPNQRPRRDPRLSILNLCNPVPEPRPEPKLELNRSVVNSGFPDTPDRPVFGEISESYRTAEPGDFQVRNIATQYEVGNSAELHKPEIGLAPQCGAVYTAVMNYFYRSTMGYSVYFGQGDPRNEFDECTGDRSSKRAELRAILRAMQRLAPLAADVHPSVWTVYTCHEATARRISPQSDSDDNIAPSRGASSMDLLLQIKELRHWLRRHGLQVVVSHVLSTEENARRAVELAQCGAEGRLSDEQRQINSHVHQEPSIPSVEGAPTEFRRVYTDGSTVTQADSSTVAGYGVYFGYFDRRNECAPVTGRGTGPRASLAAILRALVIISRANNGHRYWEIASCRGQYLHSVFELTSQWQKSGWKRNAGKPIANLSIYREARRILDALAQENIEVRAVYIPQKNVDPGIMFAGMMARRAAGDTSVEIPLQVSEVFDVPKPPGEDEPSYLWTEATYKQTELKGRYKIRFGAEPPSLSRESNSFGAFRDPRDQDGVCGSIHQSRERCAMFVVLKALRLIEQGIERYWVMYCNSTDAVTVINEYLDRATRLAGRKPPLYVESVIKHVQRLNKHGYRIEFRVSPLVDPSSEIHYQFGP